MSYVRRSAGRIRPRHLAAIMLDASAAASSLFLALHLRLQAPLPEATVSAASGSALCTAIITVLLFQGLGIYRHAWRYVSVKELLFLAQATTATVVLSSAATWMFFSDPPWLPRSVPIIQWFILLVMLGSLRVLRRMARELLLPAPASRHALARAPVERHAEPEDVLLLGDPDWAETALRTLQGPRNRQIRAVGILTHDDDGERNLSIRGVPILGTMDELENIVGELARGKHRPSYIIVNQGDACLTGPRMAKLATRAAQLGLEVARAQEPGRLQKPDDGNLDLRFVNLTDLLGRPELRLDGTVVRNAIKGRRILVTGAGGTIGSELVRQIASFEAAEILLLDHGEYNLYAIDMELRERFPDVRGTPLLCSVRQRETLVKLFVKHRPDLVFHAAALKHVPLVEQNLSAGVLTNVIGTRNVADAVIACGASAMIQVSTDKAVNPVGMMGATKRMGELYCQALDLAAPGDADGCRFLTVRFGNVLGSSGSLIPLLLRQLSRRGPLTVTHPDIERYFMTVHEAVQLILHSTAATLRGGIRRGRVFVLDMGDPIKIVEIARRMIRAAGLVPDIDVKIDFIGLRPGEKLFEELFDESEERLPSTLPGIFEAEPISIPLPELQAVFQRLEKLAQQGDAESIRLIMHSVIHMYGDDAEPAHAPAKNAPPVIAGPSELRAARL
ncbi:MAG: nucleoside-diphosphate sugar epimerase/dehydratase [Sphingobium sp.]